jgi:hypothetical protein
MRRRGLLLAVLLPLAACGGFDVRQLGKSDVDQVAEVHVRQTLHELGLLLDKLYKRNPGEWKKTGATSAQERLRQFTEAGSAVRFTEMEGKQGADAIRLVLDPAYRGDRAFGFCAGIRGMLLASWGGRTEFYLTDTLDPQALYNSARNLELASWLLRQRKDGRGRPLLLSHGQDGEEENVSFDRQFGKLIALQDALARVMEGRTQRTIKSVVQSMATAVFLPVP